MCTGIQAPVCTLPWRENATFDWKFKCNESLQSKGLINIKAKRIQNIIKCSQLYQDSIHERLQSQFNSDSSLVLQAHKVCVEKYLHPKEVQKALKRHAGNTVYVNSQKSKTI